MEKCCQSIAYKVLLTQMYINHLFILFSQSLGYLQEERFLSFFCHINGALARKPCVCFMSPLYIFRGFNSL